MRTDSVYAADDSLFAEAREAHLEHADMGQDLAAALVDERGRRVFPAPPQRLCPTSETAERGKPRIQQIEDPIAERRIVSVVAPVRVLRGDLLYNGLESNARSLVEWARRG